MSRGTGMRSRSSVERILGGRSINNNVLYPALRRFEEQGAIERVAAEADPGRPPRNVYRLTDTGHDLLQAMIRDADPALLADENEFQVRVAFFADLRTGRPAADHRGSAATSSAAGSPTWPRCGRSAAEPWGLRVLDFSMDAAAARAAAGWTSSGRGGGAAVRRDRPRPAWGAP